MTTETHHHTPSQTLPAKDLTGFFRPRSIAVIGASANSEKIGNQILRNIIDGGFTGEVYPVHPSEQNILGKTAFTDVNDIPADVDLALIAIPAGKVVQAFESCARKQIPCVAIITSGFAEVGNAGPEQQIKALADRHGISVLGPNMFGIVYEPNHLNASFGPPVSLQGRIAFISQSGALGIALMGWTEMEHIGLAAVVSVGNKSDIDERELIEYFNTDDNVDVILIYMEGLKNARNFMRTAARKPVVGLKVGRSERGAKAAASHTGALVGSDQVYDAAFKQLGILRADTFTEAFGWARTLSLPEPAGKDTVIITNGGGIGVRTTDECEHHGITLLDDPEWLEQQFRRTMPDFGSTKNPVDITGQAGTQFYGQATRIALAEQRIHCVVILYCETNVTEPVNIAQAIEQEYENAGRNKPLVVAMVGSNKTREAIQYLNERKIPAFTAVNEAVSALRALYTWKEYKSRPRETTHIIEPPAEALDIIEQARRRGETSLLEPDACRVFELCDIPTPRWGFAKNMDEALNAARGLYPVALKIVSKDILHKTEVDGVALNIRNDAELLLKYHNMMKRIRQQKPGVDIAGVNVAQMVKGIECIVGLTEDEQFGPTVMFGLGGVFVEALKTVSFRVSPCGPQEARRLIRDIKGAKILDGFRGMSINVDRLIDVIMNIQRLAGHVKEVDINPLMANKDGCFAVDARIIL